MAEHHQGRRSVQPIDPDTRAIAGNDAKVVVPGRRRQAAESLSFLDLPLASAKPRQQGITHVLDKGLSVAQVDGMVEVAGGFVDIVKLGWGTAVATGNLRPKLDRYRAHGLPVVLGGTLTELAIAQGRVDGLRRLAAELGIGHVEVSDGTIALAHERQARADPRGSPRSSPCSPRWAPRTPT